MTVNEVVAVVAGSAGIVGVVWNVGRAVANGNRAQATSAKGLEDKVDGLITGVGGINDRLDRLNGNVADIQLRGCENHRTREEQKKYDRSRGRRDTDNLS